MALYLEHSDFGLEHWPKSVIRFGWALVRAVEFWAGAGQRGRILGWDWSKWSDLARHWSEYSDFVLELIKRIGFGWALVRKVRFWDGVGQSGQIWLDIIDQNIRVLGWNWKMPSG